MSWNFLAARYLVPESFKIHELSIPISCFKNKEVGKMAQLVKHLPHIYRIHVNAGWMWQLPIILVLGRSQWDSGTSWLVRLAELVSSELI